MEILTPSMVVETETIMSMRVGDEKLESNTPEHPHQQENPIMPAMTSSTKIVDGQFTLFPKLPIELRLKIWKHTFPRPPIVSVIYQYDSESIEFYASSVAFDYGIPRGTNEWYEKCEELGRNDMNHLPRMVAHSHSLPPSTLAVCQESRRVASKKYHLRLEGLEKSHQIPIDPANDVLYFPDYQTSWQASPILKRDILYGIFNAVQYLAVDSFFLYWILPGFLPGLPNLKEMLVIEHDEDCGSGYMFSNQHNGLIEFVDIEDGDQLAEKGVISLRDGYSDMAFFLT